MLGKYIRINVLNTSSSWELIQFLQIQFQTTRKLNEDQKIWKYLILITANIIIYASDNEHVKNKSNIGCVSKSGVLSNL